ncbi:unnamed protein product [Rotaria magnacalcarata]|uniref:Uncharacterized protein n=1 Tax=Rotaria magnacalcarata TaxID=392030 RepID=A0A820AWK5_9BILA|nr:unnamed protein product [Rotaria magnacalcarata]CAF4405101.1 unnamed protein product [Rotaria magnacalcarata]CAF4659120.1 unnamed protein product [Rotaria magnacalcarata]
MLLLKLNQCEDLRDVQNSSDGNDLLMGKYGFTNRAIDGISLTITNLTLVVKSKGFKGSICFPTLDIYSTTFNGKRVDTLTLT